MKSDNRKSNIIDMDNIVCIKLEKTKEDLAEEKASYNKFMNFMANIIVKYGFIESFNSDHIQK